MCCSLTVSRHLHSIPGQYPVCNPAGDLALQECETHQDKQQVSDEVYMAPDAIESAAAILCFTQTESMLWAARKATAKG